MSDTASAPNPAVAYERLRAETAESLGLDFAADLPLTQSLQLDLISLLRLEVGDLQGKVLAGDTVDLDRLAAAFGMLQKILPPAALEAEPEVRPHSEAKEKLKALIDATILAGPSPDQPTRAELEAEVAELRERLALAGAVSAVTVPSSDNIVPLHKAPTSSPPAPVSAKAPPPPSSEREWRDWYSSGGGGGSSNFGIHAIPKGF